MDCAMAGEERGARGDGCAADAGGAQEFTTLHDSILP